MNYRSSSTERAAQELNGLVVNLSNQDKKVKKDAQTIIEQMFEYNEQLNPQTLARAAFFVAKKERSDVTKEEIGRIKKHRGEWNDSWVNLIPVVKKITG